jgi:hypothetical protein
MLTDDGRPTGISVIETVEPVARILGRAQAFTGAKAYPAGLNLSETPFMQ